jgi:hypothetical protein
LTTKSFFHIFIFDSWDFNMDSPLAPQMQDATALVRRSENAQCGQSSSCT